MKSVVYKFTVSNQGFKDFTSKQVSVDQTRLTTVRRLSNTDTSILIMISKHTNELLS